MDALSATEEVMILRLPPRLAARIGARIDRRRAKGEQSGFVRRRRKQKGDKSEITAFVNEVWGEDGAPDYDSLSEVEDLLDLEGVQEQDDEDEEEHQQNEEDKSKETQENEVLANEDCEVEYWRVEGNNFIFKYGEDEYYATLVRLPCIIEAQKATDTANLFKTADVGSMLLVHDVKASSGLPRPELDPNDLYQGDWAHGITPPMKRVLPDRFAKVSPVARREEYNLTLDDVKQADEILSEFKDLVVQMHKKADAPTSTKKGKNVVAQLPSSTVFVYEEVIDAEAWMEFSDDLIVVTPGKDKFRSSIKEEQAKARENKRKLEEKRQQAAGSRVSLPQFPMVGMPPYPQTSFGFGHGSM